jgi:hypothetical protein
MAEGAKPMTQIRNIAIQSDTRKVAKPAWLLAGLLVALLLAPASAIAQSDSHPLHFKTLAQAEAAVQAGGSASDILRADSLETVEMYKKKYGVLAAAEVFLINMAVWGTDRFILNYDFARINGETIKYNLRHGFEWDWDSFRTNQLVHPYHGSLYFNAARTLGYDYFASFAYAVGGSFMWEMFLENHPPSTNDWINTPIGGAFLGEVLYRWSELVLDDRATGAERVWREIGGLVLNPVGGINRLILGRTKHKSRFNPHIREKFRAMFSLGNSAVARTLNFENAQNTFVIQLDMWYGEWFKEREKKFIGPFDVFNLRAQLRFADTAKYANVYAYAALYGKHIYHHEEPRHIWGFFQHYDFIHNEIIEVFAHSLSPSLISKFPLGKHFDLATSAHLGVTMLGGAYNPYFTYENRDYVYSVGFAPKLDVVLEWKRRGGIYVRGAYFHQINLHEVDTDGPEGPIPATYGDDRLGFVSTSVHARIWRGLGLGVEHTYFKRNSTFDDPVDYPKIELELNTWRSFVTARF